MTKFRFALLLLSAAGMPLGCMTAPINQAQSTVALSNPVPMFNLGAQSKAAVTVRIGTMDESGFRTKADAAFFMVGDITAYAIELINDTGSAAGTNYQDGTAVVNGPTIYLDGPMADSLTGATLQADAGFNRQFAFTGVPAGSYRMRIKASNQTTGPATIPGGAQLISKPDGFFTLNSGWSISSNAAQVSNGTSVVNYGGGGTLNTTVALRGAIGDNVAGNVTVTNGASVTTIGSADM